MKSTAHHILIELDTLFNNEIDTGLVSEEGEKIKFEFDPTYEPYKYIKTKAKVIGVPNEYDSEPLTAEHHLTPKSKFDMTKFLFASDFPNPDIRVGDEVYYHYLSVRPDKEDAPSVSFVCRTSDGNQVHYVRNKELHCILRDGEIIMLFGNVLIQPSYGEEIQDIDVNGVNVKCKVTASGLITSVGEEPKLSHGTVAHINPTSFKLSRTDVSKGDEVLYRKNSEFENEIEGEKYFLMKEWDLIAKKTKEGYVPLAEYTLVKKIEEEKSLIINTEDKQKYFKAKVLKKGNKCSDEYQEGDTVHVNLKTPFALDHNEKIFLHEGEIMFVYG
jgi:co-chaperonin GroES (HSP10)